MVTLASANYIFIILGIQVTQRVLEEAIELSETDEVQADFLSDEFRKACVDIIPTVIENDEVVESFRILKNSLKDFPLEQLMIF